jgi:hypothetical protein
MVYLLNMVIFHGYVKSPDGRKKLKKGVSIVMGDPQ